MLQRAIQGSTGVLEIAWTKEDEEGNVVPQDLTGATITGTIQPIETPGSIRAIVGTLVAAAPPAAGIFNWTLAAADVVVGLYLVQFKATISALINYSFAAYWIVEPSGGIHPYSLAGLRMRLMELVEPIAGVPTPFQYTQAIQDAVTMVNGRVPMKRTALLNIVGGTDTYDLPVDFLYQVTLESAVGPGGVGYGSSGKLIAFSQDFCEEYLINGLTITFVPEPAYSAERRLWYAGGYILDVNGIYQYMTADIAHLVLLKAQASLLRLQAREAGNTGGFSYQFGDVRVDKKGKAESLVKLAKDKDEEYEAAIRLKTADKGRTA